MLTADEILALYDDRRRYYMPLHTSMREIKAVYNGEARIDLPDVDATVASSVPNLLAQGVDQMAGRIASTRPMCSFASEKPGQRRSDRRAETARMVVTGWWNEDRHSVKQKVRARHLIAYGMSPVVVRYDPILQRPTWDVRSPLETFPSPDLIPGTASPVDVVFAYRKTVGWLRATGRAIPVNMVTGDPGIADDTPMLLLEHVSPEGRTLVLAGWQQSHGLPMPQTFIPPGSARAVIIEQAPNPTGVMQAVVPTRVSLDRPGGQFDSMVGMYYQQAKLMALEVMAVEKGIFPDTYLVSRPGETGRFIDGPHDGRTGLVNVVAGGDVKEVSAQPGYMTPQVMDRLERAQRLSAGIPAEFGGESGSNIRTGRRGDAVLSAVIDFPVSEAQDVFAYALVDEDRAAIALSKHFDGDTPRSVFTGNGTASRRVKYVAVDVFETDDHSVAYPASGTDLNSLMIGLGQRVGMGIMSKETAAALDPFIDSPELEHDRIIAEGLEQSLVAGIQQQAASGQIPPLVLAKIMTLVQSDRMELADALVKVTEDAAKEQAAQQAQAGPGGMPGGPPTAEQQMAPAAQAAMAGSPIPGPTSGQGDLASLMSTLRKPTMTIQPGRGIPQGAM